MQMPKRLSIGRRAFIAIKKFSAACVAVSASINAISGLAIVLRKYVVIEIPASWLRDAVESVNGALPLVFALSGLALLSFATLLFIENRRVRHNNTRAKNTALRAMQETEALTRIIEKPEAHANLFGGDAGPSEIATFGLGRHQSSTVSRCAEQLQLEIGANVHVCLKRLTKDLKIETVARGSDCDLLAREREDEGMQPYPYKNNTAFYQILNGGKEFFCENDLIARADRGQYENSHEGWQRFYRATLVLGIKNDVGGYWGFLAADTLNGQFSLTDSLLTLRLYAHLIRSVQQSWDLMQSRRATVARLHASAEGAKQAVEPLAAQEHHPKVGDGQSE